MRFRETACGRMILRLPAGDKVLAIGRTFLTPYYWAESLRYKQVGRLTWLLANARDAQTLRALTGRLRDTERRAERLQINLRCAKGPLLVRPEDSDIEVIKEIFRFGEYRPIRGWTFPTVMDCGANCGIFAAYAQSQAGSSLRAYVGVEPDPDSFAVLSELVRLREMSPFSSLFQVAVSDKDGTANFDNSGKSWGHRLAPKGDLTVQTLTIGTLLDRARLDEVDLLKLDIEGGEKAVLESISSWRDRVKVVVVEGRDNERPFDYEWFAAVVRAAGFTPLPRSTLFFGLPCAVRNDVMGVMNP